MIVGFFENGIGGRGICHQQEATVRGRWLIDKSWLVRMVPVNINFLDYYYSTVNSQNKRQNCWSLRMIVHENFRSKTLGDLKYRDSSVIRAMGSNYLHPQELRWLLIQSIVIWFCKEISTGSYDWNIRGISSWALLVITFNNHEITGSGPAMLNFPPNEIMPLPMKSICWY